MPNNWKLDASGKLIKDVETDEYKAAVGFARDLWAAGMWHPNTPTYGGVINDDFIAGRFAFAPGVWGQYVQLWDIAAVRNPSARLYPMHPFAADGGKPYYQAGSGQFGVAYMKQQSSPDRVKMLLRVANYFAAPFGSQEWLQNYFGVKDVDFSFNGDGAPVLTEQGRGELTAVWRYISSPAYALFSANRSQEFAQVSQSRDLFPDLTVEDNLQLGGYTREAADPAEIYALFPRLAERRAQTVRTLSGGEQQMVAAMDTDPTLGLYSATAASLGPLAQDTLMSGVSDIIQGRRPIADLDSLVADWRQKAGDKMRGEFQDALAAAKA